MPKAIPITDTQRRQVVKLASMGLPDTDIGLVVGLERMTVARRCKAELEEGRAKMRRRLRVYQWKLAKRYPAMAIWLGKQYLGQVDAPLPPGEKGAVIEYVQRIVTSTTDTPDRDPGAGSPGGVCGEPGGSGGADRGPGGGQDLGGSLPAPDASGD